MKAERTLLANLTGMFGTAFAALCCIGTPILLGALGAAGVGFLINDIFLLPFLALSLFLSVRGLLAAYRRKHESWTLIIGLLGVVGVVAGMILVILSMLGGKEVIYISLLALLLATAKNIYDASSEHFTRKKVNGRLFQILVPGMVYKSANFYKVAHGIE